MHPGDQVQTLNIIHENIKELSNDHLILGRDLNIHQDQKIDKGNLKSTHTYTTT